jgi:hypothetical protein
MNRDYDPGMLLLQLALHYESIGKAVFSADVKDLKNSYIQIVRKDPEAPDFKILKDPNGSDASVLLLSGNSLMGNNELENEKDNLGKVTVSYEGRPPISFDMFQDFLKWLGIK